MADGTVKIVVITNAESVAKQFEKFDKSVEKTEKDAKKLDSSAKILKNTLQSLIAILSVRQVIIFGKELVNTTLKLEALDRQLISSVGSTELAQTAYKFVSDEAERLGLSLESALDGFAGFSASALRSNLTFEQTKQIFSDIGSALTVLNRSSAETELVFRGLEQIASKGTVSLEEIRGQLGDSLPGALALAAKSMGITQKEFIKLVSAGEVVSKDFLPSFAREIKNSLGANVEQASRSARANFNRLNNSILLLKDSFGQQLVPELVKFSKEIRNFIDNEAEDLIKTFVILIDSISIFATTLNTARIGLKAFVIIAKTLKSAISATSKDELKILIEGFKELSKESAESLEILIQKLKEFGEVDIAEKRLRNLGDAGKIANDNLKIKESVLDSFKRLIGELITVDDIANTIGDSLAAALTTPFEEGESAADRFKKVMLEILKEISRQMIALGITKLIVSGLTSTPTPTPVTPSAKGNIFSNGNIKPFANGGVVNSPALFPMQNGIGLMGEAGPEAILPLKRGKNGKLGVETSGQKGGDINIFNQSQSQIEVVKRPNNDRDIFIREFNSALISERSKGSFEAALQNQRLSGVQAS